MGGLEYRIESLDHCARRASELRHHRSVNADPSRELEARVERGDIRKADQRFEGQVAQRERVEEADASIAAARAEHRFGLRIRESAGELPEAPRVVPGQVALRGEDAVIPSRRVAAGKHLETRVEARAIERPPRCDHAYRIPGAQRRRLEEPHLDISVRTLREKQFPCEVSDACCESLLLAREHVAPVRLRRQAISANGRCLHYRRSTQAANSRSRSLIVQRISWSRACSKGSPCSVLRTTASNLSFPSFFSRKRAAA